jgi:hypothetical protein
MILSLVLKAVTSFSIVFVFLPGLAPLTEPDKSADQAQKLAQPYVEAVRKINEEHARKPGKAREGDLAKRLPKQARASLDQLLKSPDSPPVLEALLSCGEAALDLDLVDDFERVRSRLEKASPEHAGRLGTAHSRPRFVLRAIGGFKPGYPEKLAGVLDAVLEAYDEVFGFEGWSKVPGKKLRVMVHLEEKAKRPPHFAPELPYHSEIDFPVEDAAAFKSPTADGKFLFYGLCHELGHAIAMWGDGKHEEDHHGWAHYTGVAIVEHLAEKARDRPVLEGLSDIGWRSLGGERKRLHGHAPSLSDRDGVLALLIALHDAVGPRAIGQAINWLDRQDRRLRIHRVRYYTFKELKEALLSTLKSPDDKRSIGGIFAGTTG